MVVPLVFHDELTLLGAKVVGGVSSVTSSILLILFGVGFVFVHLMFLELLFSMLYFVTG